jgi:hypothetical protein
VKNVRRGGRLLPANGMTALHVTRSLILGSDGLNLREAFLDEV